MLYSGLPPNLVITLGIVALTVCFFGAINGAFLLLDGLDLLK